MFVLRRLADLDAESEIDTSSLSALTQKRFELWLVVADRWVQPKWPFKVNGKLDTDELFALWRHELGAKNRGGDLAQAVEQSSVLEDPLNLVVHHDGAR